MVDLAIEFNQTGFTILALTSYSLTNCQLHSISFSFQTLLTSHFSILKKKSSRVLEWPQQMLFREIRSEARMNEEIHGFPANMSRQ